ncbi:Riboflavin biosynthesis protein RibBA [Botrimarina colliarenosi]|uniref:Multifunctional fusion protein n=1 Tax=Botrimarina colliarenosi TaxID=2528001 RepID=A0A5C6AJB9_9BACT|nr:GTP cyclohydrolase II [Botrimarina colliarenosi]TWT99338.1 Riboflavin biosynthesis protein RibBA [Botrimarina colliarenosi]
MSHRFSTIEQAVEAIAAGRIVIVVDAEDRENEGDFIAAAETATAATVNFMITHGRGQLCTPILPDVAQRLRLPLMVDDEMNTAPLRTNYTVSVDHRTAKTGITAEERATVVRALCDADSTPNDFVRPGHMFPLIAKEGGVLRRAGHTEATTDLARMAGLKPAGLLCEVLNEAGDRAGREELHALAERFELPIITIEDLIAYRRVREKLIERNAEAPLPTKHGVAKIIVYHVKYEAVEPVAIVFGDPSTATAPLVRLHSSCFTGDVLGSLRCDCGDQLQMALAQIGAEGVGAVIYLPQEGRGIGLAAKIKAYALQDQGMDTVEANLALGFKADARDYGVGIQILKDLGMSKIRLLTNNPKKLDAVVYGGFDLEVVDQVPLAAPVNVSNATYLATKRDKMGHTLPAE